ncbi:MAG: polysaccharide pyruvyl transferase family protein [Dysosmobacter sp.]
MVICGAYGRGNAGDDAILEAILQEMRSIDPDMPITVLTKDPKATRLTYRVRTAGRMDVGTWKKAMRHAGRCISTAAAALFRTSPPADPCGSISIIFRRAHKAGCKVQMYGCGIGPVLREQHRKLAASVLNASVDVITLREPDSLKELQSMGVTKPEILLTADPALTLPAASEDEIDSVLLRAGIPPHGKYLCFALRNWKGFEDKAPCSAQAAKYAYETYGLTPVFAAVEKHLDPVAGRLAAAGLDIPTIFWMMLAAPGPSSARFPGCRRWCPCGSTRLIFAAGQGIPLAGVVYDPKVSAFLRYIGQENFLDLDALTADALKAMIDRMVSSPISPEEQAAAVQKLRQIEQVNVDTARRLLGK